MHGVLGNKNIIISAPKKISGPLLPLTLCVFWSEKGGILTFLQEGVVLGSYIFAWAPKQQKYYDSETNKMGERSLLPLPLCVFGSEKGGYLAFLLEGVVLVL